MQAGAKLRRVGPFAGGLLVVALIAGSLWWRAGDSSSGADGSGPAKGALAQSMSAAVGVPIPDNPVSDDPGVVGEAPEIDPFDPAEAILARDAQALETDPPALKARPGAPDPGPEADPDSLLITFAEDASDDEVAAALEAAGVSGERLEGTNVVKVATAGHDHAAVAAALDGADGVESVDPNLVRRATKDSNDPQLGAQATALDTVQVRSAWDVADQGAPVVVAVLDSGVDLDHPDLEPNLVAGYDFVNNDAVPADDFGHGTETAGVIGAATNNGIAVAGVAWNAKIMPIKVLDAQGRGFDDDISQAIRWAADHGAKVINLSLGGPGTSSLIDHAVAHARARDVLVIAAAGNASTQYPHYPAAAPGVLGISATDHAGQFAWFSNHGPWIDLAAPGIDIVTTALAPGTTPAVSTTSTGTSFSSPIVAGVAALVRERHPRWTWGKVAYELMRTARDAGPAGVDDAYGFGIVDAAAALDVARFGAVAQPNLAGDAGNLPTAARTITVGAPATESLAYEYDEDWFSFTAAEAAGATIKVTPPAALPEDEYRAAEMDPIVELYGPGGGLIARVDDTFLGEAEEMRVNVTAGEHTIRVLSYTGSASPAPYAVEVEPGGVHSGWAPWRSEFAVASHEEAVAVADFTGDGRDDIALVTGHNADPENDSQLFLFTQTVEGSLSPPLRMSTHLSYPTPGSLIAGDLDADGDIDLGIGTSGGLDVSWNEGGLQDTVLYPSETAWALALAEVDGSAPPELISFGGTDGSNLRLMRWTGTGFASTPIGQSGNRMFAAGDVNSDGRPDLVTTSFQSLHVHTGDVDGTWNDPTTFSLASHIPEINDVLVGDVTGDGRGDVIVAGGGNQMPSGQGGPRLLYLPQQDGGTLGAPVVLPTHDIPRPVKAADVTSDGRNDALVLHDGWSAVGIYEQGTSGGLLGEQLLQIPNVSWYHRDGLSVGDVDGDGNNDLVIADANNGLIVVRHQAGTALPEGAGAWFSAVAPAPHATGVAASVEPAVTFGRDVVPSSVNASTVGLVDGRTGAVVPSTFALSGRTLTFTPSRPLLSGVPYQVVVWGVAAVGSGEQVGQTFPFTTAPPAQREIGHNVSTTYSPFDADLDGNGFDDVFWYGPGSDVDAVWMFGPDGKRGSATTVRGTYTPVVGDFDANGYDDVLWYAPGTATDVTWSFGPNGHASKITPVNGVYRPTAGDFDRNGYTDIFWYPPGTGTDVLWSFGPSGLRSSLQNVPGDFTPVAGDYNRDGYDDIFWYKPGVAVEAIWTGGPFGFGRTDTRPVDSTVAKIWSTNANGDGYDDLLFFPQNTSEPRHLFWLSGPSGFTDRLLTGQDSAVRPITGDFTGDGSDDLFAYQPGPAVDLIHPGPF